MEYEIYVNAMFGKIIKRLRDNAWIPFAVENAAYQEYLSWVAEGNSPTVIKW